MSTLLENPFVLAPMAGITDMPFRRLMKKMGAGCVISEFVSAHAIVHSRAERTARYMSFHEDERPVGIQIFGGEPDILAEAARILEDRGVDFVDINLGCPVPKVTKKRGGSAWLCYPVELGQMLKQVKSAIKVPLTIKIRTGWDANSVNCREIMKIAREEGVRWVGLHGRTRAQGYAGHADWDLIDECSREAGVPVIGNGDIVSGPLAAARLFETACEGVMIGRGALKNPWIFQEAVEAYRMAQSLSEEEKLSLVTDVLAHHRVPAAGAVPEGRSYYERRVKNLQPKPVAFTADWIRIRSDRDARAMIEMHLALLREVYPEVRVKLAFRKFLAWYAAGYPNAHQFRKFIFTEDSFPLIIERSLEFFDSVKRLGARADEMREEDPVLMSGHG